MKNVGYASIKAGLPARSAGFWERSPIIKRSNRKSVSVNPPAICKQRHVCQAVTGESPAVMMRRPNQPPMIQCSVMSRGTRPSFTRTSRLPLRLAAILTLALTGCGTPITPTTTPRPITAPTALATATAKPTQMPTPAPRATTAAPTWNGPIEVFPGPDIYSGDRLTFQIPITDYLHTGEQTAVISLDNGDPITVTAIQRINGLLDRGELLLPEVVDTQGLTGAHTLRITTPLQGRPLALDALVTFDVLPTEQRPEQERELAWQSQAAGEITIYFLSHTAAARDIDQIVSRVEEAVSDVEARIGSLRGPLAVNLIDTVWGNGAFAGSREITMTYSDRNYGPAIGLDGLDVVLRHEATHVAVADNHLLSPQASGYFGEGLAVYLAGGHYKTEPIPARAAALRQIGAYVPLGRVFTTFTSNHEVRYLESAAVIAYLESRYGWDALLPFFKDSSYPSEEWLGAALKAHFGLSLFEFEEQFTGWLDTQDVGSQADDLKWTLAIQEIRRQYQSTRAPFPLFWLDPGMSIREMGQPTIWLRRSAQPEDVAFELMLKNAQAAIRDGQFDVVQSLADAMHEILDNGQWTKAPQADYLDIVNALANPATDVGTITIAADGQSSVATLKRPDTSLEPIELRRIDGLWRLAP